MEALPLRNPFDASIVTDPGQVPPVDVPGIHRAAFEKCVAAVERVRATMGGNGQSASVVLYGEPGVGKSHLLARLRQHLNTKSQSDRRNFSVTVTVRMNTAPRRLWRHLREQFVDELQRNFAEDRSYLAWITAIKLAETPKQSTSPETWHAYLTQPKRDKDGLDLFFNQTVKDRNVAIVLRHLFLGEHPLDAPSWLRGDSLPQAALDRLGVGSEGDTSEDSPEDRARKVVQAICKLGAAIPFAFCFDQIEALRTEDEPTFGLQAFGRMAAELFDGATNAVIVSCIQSAFFVELQRAVREADKDRILRNTAELGKLPWEQCVELVTCLLDSHPEIAARNKRIAARAVKGLWPLNEPALRKRLPDLPVTSRRLIRECEELYADVLGGVAPPIPNINTEPANHDDYLQTWWDEKTRQELAKDAPANADNSLDSGLPQALVLFAPGWKPAENDATAARAEVKQYVKDPGKRIGWSLCNRNNMKSLEAHLRKLREHLETDKNRYARFVLLRHPNLPISPGAKKVAEHLAVIRGLGVPLINPPVEAFAALAALRDLLAAAKSGDLHAAGGTVRIETVREWLAAHPPVDLSDLLGHVLPEGKESDDTDGALTQALLAALQECPVAGLDQLAAELRRDGKDVLRSIERNPHLFGMVEGAPTPAVFLAAESSVEAPQN